MSTVVDPNNCHSSHATSFSRHNTQYQAQSILKYIRNNFTPFLSRLRPEVSRLLGSLAFCGELENSPYYVSQYSMNS